MLGLKQGIFISDSAREQLKLNLSFEQFEGLKDEVNKGDPDEKYQCFITEKWFKRSEGLFLTKEMVADSIQKVIDTAEEREKDLKVHMVRLCFKCGTEYHASVSECPHCHTANSLKDYKKQVIMPYTKKLALKLFVNSLRKKK
jgi:diphthamide synthase (EF-2-diphthine--ammonia ligase)